MLRISNLIFVFGITASISLNTFAEGSTPTEYARCEFSGIEFAQNEGSISKKAVLYCGNVEQEWISQQINFPKPIDFNCTESTANIQTIAQDVADGINSRIGYCKQSFSELKPISVEADSDTVFFFTGLRDGMVLKDVSIVTLGTLNKIQKATLVRGKRLSLRLESLLNKKGLTPAEGIAGDMASSLGGNNGIAGDMASSLGGNIGSKGRILINNILFKQVKSAGNACNIERYNAAMTRAQAQVDAFSNQVDAVTKEDCQ